MTCSAWLLRGVIAALVVVSSDMSGHAQPSAPTRPAVPVEPIGAILDAFRSHAVVALGEGAHGNEQGHSFRLSLIRDPRFAAVVNDIVVEFGSARYQDIMDRFVRGDDVPDASLRQIWQNTTQAQASVLDSPIYEEFFRAVRAVNASLPAERQLRVLLGDPPIDWDRVHSEEEHRKWIEMRELYPAALIQLEVLARQRRALVIYGDMHLQRKQLLSNYVMDDWRAQGIVSLLERTSPTEAFTIYTNTSTGLEGLQADVASWRKPSLAILRGTALGAADFSVYYPFATTRFLVQEGNLVPIPHDQWRSLRMEDQFDAVLYLGPPSTITFSQMRPALCSDRAYMKMRLQRMAFAGPQSEIDSLKQYCATMIPNQVTGP